MDEATARERFGDDAGQSAVLDDSATERGIDERLQPLGRAHPRRPPFRKPLATGPVRELQGVSDEEAVPTLAAWCKRQVLEMSFVTRRVRNADGHLRCAQGEAWGVMMIAAPERLKRLDYQPPFKRRYSALRAA